MGPLIPGLLATGLAVAGIVWGKAGPIPRAEKVQPSYDLVLCPSENIDRAALGKAVSWWFDHGEHFTVLPPNATTDQSCIPILEDQTIPDDEYVGETEYLVDQEYAIIGAVIFVLDGSDAEVLAHELGHVAGYGHVPLAPHGTMMARKVGSSGWDCRGLPNGVRHRRWHHR